MRIRGVSIDFAQLTETEVNTPRERRAHGDIRSCMPEGRRFLLAEALRSRHSPSLRLGSLQARSDESCFKVNHNPNKQAKCLQRQDYGLRILRTALSRKAPSSQVKIAGEANVVPTTPRATRNTSSAALSSFRGIKVTGYRLLNTVLSLGFITIKVVCGFKTDVSPFLNSVSDWILGGIAAIM